MELAKGVHLRRVAADGEPQPITWIGGARFRQFRVEFDPGDRALWVRLSGWPINNFNPELIDEAHEIQCGIEASRGHALHAGEIHQLEYVILCGSAGTFSLGGDLELFLRLIREKDKDALRRYARACIDLVMFNLNGCGIGATTIALVSGEALGGGMEAALSTRFLVAEKSSKFGLPEVLFGLFPGMGAYSLLRRRVGPARAEEMILSGATWSAEELYRAGIVDVLADDGTGKDAVRDLIDRHRRKRQTYEAMRRIRELADPITADELVRIVDLWTDMALRLDARSLSIMERLAKNQAVRASSCNPRPYSNEPLSPVSVTR